MDVQLRRQMITSCKLLVDWTRGKNLIISSAAHSVTEMRGPYDVANLCSLLGLSMEHAKAALSKNCRSLIAKALRKKHYYKDAIRVEIIPTGQGFESNEHWPKDWMKWDPISSGEGDLFLDDMAKCFSDANKVAKVVKPIDFASITDKLPSHGLQVHKLKPITEATAHSFETDLSFTDTEPTKFAKTFLDRSEDLNPLSLEDMAKSFSVANAVDKTVEPIDFASITDKHPSHGLQVHDLKPVTVATVQALETDLSFADTEPTKLEKISVDHSENRKHTSPPQHQNSCEASVKLTLSTQTQGYRVNSEISETHTAEGVEKHNDSNVFLHGTGIFCLQSQNCIRRCDTEVDQLDRSALIESSLMDIDRIGAREAVTGADNSSQPTNDVFSVFNVKTSSHSGVALGSQDDGMKSVSTEMNLEVEEDTQLTSYDLNDMDNRQLKEMIAVPDAITRALPLVGVSYDEEYKTDHIATNEVSIVTNTEVKRDLSQTLCVSNEENSHLLEMKDAPVALPVLVPQDEMSGSSGCNTVISEPSNEVTMKEQTMAENHAQGSSQATILDRSSGKRKRKPRMPSQAFVFPFKRILNRTPFKKKSHKATHQGKLL